MQITNMINCTNGLWFAALLTILYSACKLLGIIAWPWLWVISPMLVYTLIIGISLSLIILSKDH